MNALVCNVGHFAFNNATFRVETRREMIIIFTSISGVP